MKTRLFAMSVFVAVSMAVMPQAVWSMGTPPRRTVTTNELSTVPRRKMVVPRIPPWVDQAITPATVEQFGPFLPDIATLTMVDGDPMTVSAGMAATVNSATSVTAAPPYYLVFTNIRNLLTATVVDGTNARSFKIHFPNDAVYVFESSSDLTGTSGWARVKAADLLIGLPRMTNEVTSINGWPVFQYNVAEYTLKESAATRKFYRARFTTYPSNSVQVIQQQLAGQ